MFVTYNMVEFGKAIKEIRKSSKLTQLMVQKKTLIHIDTLRRLENGTTIPKYETLEILSKLFHIDLLEVLKSKRVEQTLFDFYNKMDVILLKNEIADLNSMKEEYIKLLSETDDYQYLIDKNEIQHLQIFIEACQLFYTEDKNELIKAQSIICESLLYSNSNFSVSTIGFHNYSELEMRLLHILGTVQMSLEQYQDSILIFRFLIDCLSNKAIQSDTSRKLIIKAFTNLAYCYHLMDDHKMALAIADEGIDFSVKNELYYMLYSLYGRKSIAEYNLQNDNSIGSFKKCIHLLEISKQVDLCNTYKSIFKNKYAMNFE